MMLDSLIILVFMFSNSTLRRRKEMVFSDNIKVELNAFKSHSNHKKHLVARLLFVCVQWPKQKLNTQCGLSLVVIFSSRPLAYLVWDKALDECPRSSSWNGEEWGITRDWKLYWKLIRHRQKPWFAGRGPYFVNYEKCLLFGQLYLG